MPFIQKVEKMLKNKFFIAFLGIMLVVALVYNISYFTSRGKPKVRKQTNMAVETIDPPPSENVDKSAREMNSNSLKSIYKPSNIVDNLKRITVENKPWGRNPFLTPDEEMSIRLTSSKGEGEDKEPAIIKGILIGEKQRVAIIDHKIVTEGDWIGAEQVVRIDKDKVVLTLGKSQRVITMEKSPVSIIVEETKHNEI